LPAGAWFFGAFGWGCCGCGFAARVAGDGFDAAFRGGETFHADANEACSLLVSGEEFVQRKAVTFHVGDNIVEALEGVFEGGAGVGIGSLGHGKRMAVAGV
jgi:hypothetical protein